MAPNINEANCNLCGICVDNCPGDVFELAQVTGAAVTARPVACWHCGTCEVDCPTGAIDVELPIMIIA